MSVYVNSLSPEKQKLIRFSESSKAFKFGSGEVHKSLYITTVPATIGKENIFIETDVVKLDIPMLLS